MISTKKLIKLARKWQKLAALKRKRILFPRISNTVNESNSSTSSSTVDKGHFVVYTADQRRFVIPLLYLKNELFAELLTMAKEEYGLPSDGPIILPCDAVTMEYVISIIKRHADKNLQKALVMSIVSGRCSSSFFIQQGLTNQQFLLRGF